MKLVVDSYIWNTWSSYWGKESIQYLSIFSVLCNQVPCLVQHFSLVFFLYFLLSLKTLARFNSICIWLFLLYLWMLRQCLCIPSSLLSVVPPSICFLLVFEFGQVSSCSALQPLWHFFTGGFFKLFLWLAGLFVFCLFVLILEILDYA